MTSTGRLHRVTESDHRRYESVLASGSGLVLQSLEEVVVVSMRAYPEPEPILIGADGQGSVLKRNAGGVDRPRRVDLLELKTRMGGIIREGLEGFSSSVLDVSGKCGEGLTEGTGSVGSHKVEGSSLSVLPAL
jgi:hypothetical protein